jgi:hypothetical protein
LSLLERIIKIDRRIIFLTVALVVAIPILRPMPLRTRVSPPVRDLFTAVDTLAPGSVVMISIDYDPTSAPELYPANLALAKHCFSRGLRIISVGFIAPGIPLGQQALEEAAAEYGKKYGVDYVILGYKTAPAATLIMMGKEIWDIYPKDHLGRNVAEYSLMREVHNYENVALVLDFAHGALIDSWIGYVGARFRKPVGVFMTAVMAAQYYPYYDSGQLVGLSGGLKGSAEYESLIKKPGRATAGMTAQSFAHLAIMAFIVLGNVAYFATRRKKATTTG